MLQQKHIWGFTLLEIMLAIVILAILIIVAVPMYMHHVRKSHRINAIQTLHALQLEEEKYRYSNTTYSGSLALPTINNYTFSISNISTTSYTLTATATNNQVNDAENGTSCAVLTLSVVNGAVTNSPQACWSN
jgi:type IV pilus assembly protein PilE